MTNDTIDSNNGQLENGSPKPLEVLAGAPDKPLLIGDIDIHCYVLEDETRVLTQRAVHKTIRFHEEGEGHSRTSDTELPRFASQNWLQSYISKSWIKR